MSHNGTELREERTSSHCVASGTVVETPNGARAVEQIRVGDQVWGYDINRQKPVVVKVIATDPKAASETITIGKLRVTADHPIFVKGEWKPACKLKSKDQLLGSNLEQFEAGPIENVPGSVHVYDVKVEAPENFFAGGVLVHNKSQWSTDRSV